MDEKVINAEDSEPKIVGFLCDGCCYGGADMAGLSRMQYTTNIRIIRVMCFGRVDSEFILDAFRRGADGVSIGDAIQEIATMLKEMIGLNDE